MLDVSIVTQLRAHLGLIRHPVRLTAWLDDSSTSSQTRQLLEQLVDVAEKLELVMGELDGERTPSFAIHRPEEVPRVRFGGLPLGHELTSLVLALLHVGGHPAKEPEDLLVRARDLDVGPLRFETFFSQSCQNCPDVVQALNLLSVLNPQVEHVAVDGQSCQAEVEARGVMAVPTVFLNGEVFGSGRMDLAEILGRLDDGAEARAAEALRGKEVFDMLVVGAGPAGAAAAIYAARKGIRTGMVTEKLGGQLLDTAGIENFVSLSMTEGPKLASALEAHVGDYPVDVMKRQRAAKLVPGAVHEVVLESGATLRSRSVVLATGARWRNLGVPGEREYRNKGVTYCPHCDGPLFKGKRVAVIGGGNSGVEAAIDLAGIVSHVTVLEFSEELKADAVLLRRLESLSNVDVVVHAATTEVLGDGSKVTGVRYDDRVSRESRELSLEGIFVQIGLLPNTEWLDGSVELSKYGEIVVDAKNRTSVPGVFAAGDVTTVPFKQIIIAAGAGANAALGAFDHLIRAEQ